MQYINVIAQLEHRIAEEEQRRRHDLNERMDELERRQQAELSLRLQQAEAHLTQTQRERLDQWFQSEEHHLEQEINRLRDIKLAEEASHQATLAMQQREALATLGRQREEGGHVIVSQKGQDSKATGH